MSAIINNKNLNSTIYVNGKQIKYIGYNGKLILKPSYAFNINSLSIVVRNITDGINASSYSAACRATVDEDNKKITIHDLIITATFNNITTSNNRNIVVNISVGHEDIRINGDYTYTNGSEYYMVGTQTGISNVEIGLNNLELTFYNDKIFYASLEVTTNWVN